MEITIGMAIVYSVIFVGLIVTLERGGNDKR